MQNHTLTQVLLGLENTKEKEHYKVYKYFSQLVEMSKVYIEVLKFIAVTSTAQNTQQVVY